MRRFGAFALFSILAAAAAATAPLADEGRIPVFQPTTISNPGHYVVTRDIVATAGAAIGILADNVVLDLNGHTISEPFAQPVILVFGTSNDVTILNGKTSGGTFGIESQTTVPTRIRIESVSVSGTSAEGIDIRFPDRVEIVSCRIESPGGDSGITVNSLNNVESFGGRFIGNTVSAPDFNGMRFHGLRNGEIRGNTILHPGLNGYGIRLDAGSLAAADTGGNLIVDNQVFMPVSAGIVNDGIIVNDSGNLIRHNVVMTSGGIIVVGNNNLLVENLVSRGHGDGFFIVGSNNHLEGNEAVGMGGCGIDFAASVTNIYRNNILRGNLGGATCGVAATNGGGNIS